MPIALTIIAHAVPTLMVWIALARRLPFQSKLLLFAVSWFSGQFLFTNLSYLLSCILVNFFVAVLYKAAVFVLVLFVCVLLYQIRTEIKAEQAKRWIELRWSTVVITVISILTSWSLFSSQLAYKDGQILRSPGFWDIGYQALLIQSFVFGDNFPAQSYSYAGAPLAYHFGPFINTAIYATFGLELVHATNFCSILTFAILLFAIVGLAEEIFSSRIIGSLAVLLTLTASSLRMDLVSLFLNLSFTEFVDWISLFRYGPAMLSFSQERSFGYNGMMFNIFYFVAERQLIFAALFLLVASALIWHCDHMTCRGRIALGILFALFFRWHLFVTIMVAALLGVLFLIEPRRRRILFEILLPFALVFVVQVVEASVIANSPSYDNAFLNNFPRISFNFPTMPKEWAFTPWNAFQYWIYAYGVKILLFAGAIIFLRKSQPKAFRMLLAIIGPTFILISMVELSPISIYDNHKWLRPMNIFVDLICASALAALFAREHRLRSVCGVAAILLATLSGAIENSPYFLATPDIVYASYPTPFIQELRARSQPHDVFLGSDSKSILLAGRKTFTRLDREMNRPVIASDEWIRKDVRLAFAEAIYTAINLEQLCQLTTRGNIRFLETNKALAISTQNILFDTFLPFSVINQAGRRSTFLDMRTGCKLNSLS